MARSPGAFHRMAAEAAGDAAGAAVTVAVPVPIVDVAAGAVARHVVKKKILGNDGGGSPPM